MILLVVGLAVYVTFSAGAEAASLSEIGAPVLSVSGKTVQWSPVGLESSYTVAVSNAPRGAADRETQYFYIERAPGSTQSYTPTVTPGETVYVGVAAEGGPWSTDEVAVGAPVAPALSVSGQTALWSSIGNESSYTVAVSNAPRGAADRETQYFYIERAPGSTQSYTPTVTPGETVYVGVAAEGGPWSTDEVAISAPLPTPQPEPEPESALTASTPVLSVHGDTVSWTAIPGATSYTLATVLHPTTTRETTYTTLSPTTTSVTPPVLPGQTVDYGLAAQTTEGGPWAQEVTITYPPATTGEGTTAPVTTGEETTTTETSTTTTTSVTGEGTTTTPPTPPPPPKPRGKIIGTNNGAGWGESFAKTILAGHITWNRVEIGSEANTIAESVQEGYHNLAIVGNPNDNTPLSQIEPNAWAAEVVSQLKNNPGISIAEAGNEMYLKGGIAEPVQYGKMYLAAVNAKNAAGIHTPLLFNMFGDYAIGPWANSSGWSQDANNGGWLRTAVNAVPGLATAILANGLSSHPYGALNENTADYGGVKAIPAQEAVAKTVLGATPPIYITEFGYNLNSCGEPAGACTQEEQATKTKAAYKAFLADPHVAGIWWYQMHDDGTGQFGFLNDNDTPRPTYNILSAFAIEQGQ